MRSFAAVVVVGAAAAHGAQGAVVVEVAGEVEAAVVWPSAVQRDQAMLLLAYQKRRECRLMLDWSALLAVSANMVARRWGLLLEEDEAGSH